MKPNARISGSHFLGEESNSIEYSATIILIILKYFFHLMIKVHYVICFPFPRIFIIWIFYKVLKHIEIFSLHSVHLADHVFIVFIYES